MFSNRRAPFRTCPSQEAISATKMRWKGLIAFVRRKKSLKNAKLSFLHLANHLIFFKPGWDVQVDRDTCTSADMAV
jgi:hypothetical protein